MKAEFDTYLQSVSTQLGEALQLIPAIEVSAFHYFWQGHSVAHCVDGLMRDFLT